MKAIVLDETNQFKYFEVSIPVPKENELLIEVMAAGVNRTDIFTKHNNIKKDKILGIEVSGIVKKSNTNRFM